MKQIQSICRFSNGSTHQMRTAICSFQYGILFVLLLLSNLNLCYSQLESTIYSVFQTDSIVSLPFDERPMNVQICFDGSKTYILDENTSNNSILLRNINHLFDDTLQINIPDTLSLKNKSRIQSISINNHYIIISAHKKILLFQRMQDSIKYIRFYETRFPCNYIRISNNAIIGISSKIANVDDQNSGTWLFRISLFDTVHYYDGIKLIEPLGIEFTYFAPQVHVSIYDSLIMIADIINYNIRIYNHYGALVDSISRNTSSWFSNRLYMQNMNLKDSIRALFRYPKNNIELLRPYFDSIRILRHIAVLNHNHLLVAWQFPERWIRKDKTLGPPKMNYDIWKYENSKWSMSNIDLIDVLPEPSDSIVRFNGNNYLGFNYYATDEALYRLNNWIPKSINYSPLTFGDIYKIQDSIAAINSNCFALFRIMIKPNNFLAKTIETERSENHVNKIQTDSLIGCNINSFSEKLHSSDSTTIILLINDYNCRDCITSTIEAINYSIQHTQNPIKVILLTRTKKSIASKNEAIKKIRKISKNYQVLFDCINGDTDKWPPTNIVNGIFGMFNVSKTPALIVIHKDQKIEFMNYEKINNIIDNPNELRSQINMIISD